MSQSAISGLSEETEVPSDFQRPTRRHALDIARNIFLRGERLEMGELCARLGIGRTTLHRWVGDREQLIGEVLGEFVDAAWELVNDQARGEGVARVIDGSRRFMKLTAEFRPVREFVEREPQLALKLLLTPDGVVQQRIREGSLRSLERNWPGSGLAKSELVDIAVQVGTALEWVPIVIGHPPEIDRAVRLITCLFETELQPRGNDSGAPADR